MGDKLESVADRSGETKQFAPEVIAVTEAIHKSGRDSVHLSKHDIILAASPIFERMAKNGSTKQAALVHVPKRNDAQKADRPAPKPVVKTQPKPAAKVQPKAPAKPVQKAAPKPPAKVAPKPAPKAAAPPPPIKPAAKSVAVAKSKLKVAQAPKAATAPAPVRPTPVVRKATVETKKSNAAQVEEAHPAPQNSEQPEEQPAPETTEAEAHVEEHADVPPQWEETQPPPATVDGPDETDDAPVSDAAPQPTPEGEATEPAPEAQGEEQPPEGQAEGGQDPTVTPNDGLPKTQEEALEEERRVQESLQTLTNENTLSLLNQPGYNPYIAMTSLILSALQICEFFDKMPGNEQRKTQLDSLASASQDLVTKYEMVQRHAA
jgi:hypothetical protein